MKSQVGDWRKRQRIQSLQVRISRWLTSATYTRKWLVLGTLVGVVAGLGAVLFYDALRLASYLFLQVVAGYHVPEPISEGGHMASATFARPWAIPLVACGGALLGAILVYSVAPEAEGHGTDAAIAAVHHNPRGVRFRTVFVKIVASALTIGSGGSGGREGPTGQISAGFGSLLARTFDLSPEDARLTVASGIGSGIGAIFGAPLGGAVLATEILYRDDFEVEALLPAFIASIVGYAVWGSFEGFGPLFGYVGNYQLTSAMPLLWFGVIGIVGGFVGLLYAKGFYGIDNFVCPASATPVGTSRHRRPTGWLHCPRYSRSARHRIRMDTRESRCASPPDSPLDRHRSAICAHCDDGTFDRFRRLRGIFGPGMVIGAFVGAAVWRLLEPVVPSLGHDPAPYVIVGMMACFGSISRAPLAVMLMVAEMTGTLSLIVPAMLAVGLATLIVRRSDDTIYRSQLKSRAESPAHRILTGLPLLAQVPVIDAMAPARCVLVEPLDREDSARNLEERGVTAAPIVDADGRYRGVVTLDSLRDEQRPGEPAADVIVDLISAPVFQNIHLDVVLDLLTTTPQTWATVIDFDSRVIGTIALSDIVRNYRRTTKLYLRRLTELGGTTGVVEVVVGADSSIAGSAIRSSKVPRGVLVTSIERGNNIIRPTGDTVVNVGDRITALGAPSDLDQLVRDSTGPGLTTDESE